MQSLLILGRQPAIGIAEVESLYGADKLRPAGRHAVVIDIDPCLLAFGRLGGATKFCKVLTILPTTAWKKIEQFLVKVSPEHSQEMPEGKMRLGLSLYDFNESIKQIEATGLTVKKAIRKTGRSVRLVPNKTTELNSAQIIHNQLTGPTGWDLVFIRDGEQTIVAQTIKAQDINAYTNRDRERPKRDTKVGMLPPKLAQIIINLASGPLPEDKLASICDTPAGQQLPRPILNQTVLDPFCGTGVVLQEAILMGYNISGTDNEPRMIEYSKQNLDWLTDKYGLGNIDYPLSVGDATNYHWEQSINLVASETYLGRPFTRQPEDKILAQTVTDCNLIIKKFLRNIHSQVESGTRFCIAIPAWQIRPNVFRRLPLIDQIEDLGYNRVSFEHTQDEDLLYFREEQIVARQLLVITKQ